MTIRAGINGFGRMGRLGFRAAWGNPAFDIVHVNEIAGDAACMAHLLDFDSVHGRWQRSIAAGTKAFSVDGKPIGYSMRKTPGEVDWAGMGIELVIECSGKFKTAQVLQPYFDHGVKKVLVSAPVPVVVHGVRAGGRAVVLQTPRGRGTGRNRRTRGPCLTRSPTY
jgi:glyceraldehyde 3-phosphate dehydrogenase